ncbi:MAG: asparagine synthase-related protein [Rhodobacteraceae bacterium]|jgi:asparagine synthase (glutamine-hydrolysing)|nr:asparagine synthase-related protein [Paracoccaceae bacterium]
MTHAYAVRVGLHGDADARLARMDAQGWQVTHPVEGVAMAWQGAAQVHRDATQTLCGLVLLDSRDEICAALDLPPDQAAALPDLALVARARAMLGRDAARLLSGSFSVVIVDHDTGALEGWRDHFGVYPFYHIRHGTARVAGSDLRAVLHLSGLDPQPDPFRIADFIRGDEVERDRTAFAGVMRLPAGHTIQVTAGDLAVTRYWEPSLPPPTPITGAPERLRAALAAATAARVAPDTGAMLSGGLDSTSLAGLAAQAARAQGLAQPHTLSFVYGADKRYDESHHIDAANAAFGTRPHTMPVTDAPDLSAIRDVVEEQMDLFPSPGLQKSRRIYAEARTLGLTALIDGHGGDEVVSHGYARLVELAAARAWWPLMREARGASRVHGTPFWSVYLGHVAQYGGLAPRDLRRRLILRFLRRRGSSAAFGSDPRRAIGLISPALRDQVQADTRYAQRPAFRDRDEFRNAARLQNLSQVSHPLIQRAFEVLHRAATAAGVLPVYPFYDRRVVDLCLSLPAEAKMRDGQTRWVLREAMRGLLPESIRTRADKAEFSDEVITSVRRYFDTCGPDPFQPLAAYVDRDQANALLAELRSGALTDRKDNQSVFVLWRLAVLLHWMRALPDWQARQAEGTLT